MQGQSFLLIRLDARGQRWCSCETTSIGRKIKGAPIVLVVVLVLDKILILEDEHENEDEDEDEKYQIRSTERALI